MGLEDKDEKVAKMLATIGTLDKDQLISLINHYETVWALTEDKGSINVQHMVGFNEGQFFDEADIDKTTVPPLPKKIDMRVVEDKSNKLFLMFKQIGARLNVLSNEKGTTTGVWYGTRKSSGGCGCYRLTLLPFSLQHVCTKVSN